MAIIDYIKKPDERLRQSIIHKLMHDPILLAYLKDKKISKEVIEKYPFQLQRWREKYQIYLDATDKPNFFEGFKIDGHFEIILEASNHWQKEQIACSHLAYYTYSELAPEFSKVSFLSIRIDKEKRNYLNVVDQLSVASYENKGIYLEGNLGSGKTYLAACACNSHAQKKEYVSFVHMPNFSQKMLSLMGNGEYEKYFKRVQKADFLVLDDIGAEVTNAWVRDVILLPILMYRYDHKLCTWFTSNLSLDSLKEKYAKTSLGEDMTAALRIVERIAAMTKSIELKGVDRRIK